METEELRERVHGRAGHRTEARYIRSEDAVLSHGTGTVQTLALSAAFCEGLLRLPGLSQCHPCMLDPSTVLPEAKPLRPASLHAWSAQCQYVDTRSVCGARSCRAADVPAVGRHHLQLLRRPGLPPVHHHLHRPAAALLRQCAPAAAPGSPVTCRKGGLAWKFKNVLLCFGTNCHITGCYSEHTSPVCCHLKRTFACPHLAACMRACSERGGLRGRRLQSKHLPRLHGGRQQQARSADGLRADAHQPVQRIHALQQHRRAGVWQEFVCRHSSAPGKCMTALRITRSAPAACQQTCANVPALFAGEADGEPWPGN